LITQTIHSFRLSFRSRHALVFNIFERDRCAEIVAFPFAVLASDVDKAFSVNPVGALHRDLRNRPRSCCRAVAALAMFVFDFEAAERHPFVAHPVMPGALKPTVRFGIPFEVGCPRIGRRDLADLFPSIVGSSRSEYCKSDYHHSGDVTDDDATSCAHLPPLLASAWCFAQ